jgi:GH25 family lysozyme M1 (1,4-beta-N-acetylmuramidase)
MPRIDGFDVSHWNTVTATADVPELPLMSCKATEGRSFVSPTLTMYASMFEQKAARYSGVYHWIRSDSSVQAQVDNLLNALNKVGWIEPSGALRVGALIQLDWERTTKNLKDRPPEVLPDPPVAMIEEWVDRVQQRFGDRVIVYSADWMPAFAPWRERNPGVPLWYANYNSESGRKKCTKYNADVWQWSSKTKVSGFLKGIDVNEILTVATLERITGQSGGPPPIQPITGAEVDPDDIGDDDEGGQNVSTHIWMPKGFHNQFEMPGCLPVTPAEVLEHSPRRAPLDPGNPFAALPVFSEFHPHRFLAILHRNGITREQIADGYFIRDGSVELTDEQRDFYQRQGIAMS